MIFTPTYKGGYDINNIVILLYKNYCCVAVSHTSSNVLLVIIIQCTLYFLSLLTNKLIFFINTKTVYISTITNFQESIYYTQQAIILLLCSNPPHIRHMCWILNKKQNISILIRRIIINLIYLAAIVCFLSLSFKCWFLAMSMRQRTVISRSAAGLNSGWKLRVDS